MMATRINFLSVLILHSTVKEWHPNIAEPLKASTHWFRCMPSTVMSRLTSGFVLIRSVSEILDPQTCYLLSSFHQGVQGFPTIKVWHPSRLNEPYVLLTLEFSYSLEAIS